MERPDRVKRALLFTLAAAAVTAAISYCGFWLRRVFSERKTQREREKRLDSAIADSMDASDAVARY